MNTQAIKVVEIENIRHLKDVLRMQEFDLAVGPNAAIGVIPPTGVTIWLRNNPDLHAPWKRHEPTPKMVNVHPVPGYTEYTLPEPDTYKALIEILRERIFTSFTVANYGGSGTYI